ncbi:hypothetical protein [Nocardia sp. NPDC004123]
MINRLAPLTAIAAGALFFPALLAPPASAAIDYFTADTSSGIREGGFVPCTTTWKVCIVTVTLVGEDQYTPASLSINGRVVARNDDGTTLLGYDWTPATTGTYTLTATQGASTKTITVDITKVGPGFPTGSAS